MITAIAIILIAIGVGLLIWNHHKSVPNSKDVQSKPDALMGGWIVGRWAATPNLDNGKILGDEVEFIDSNSKKEFHRYKDRKLVESGTWEYDEYPNIKITTSVGNEKFRIDITVPEGNMVVSYIEVGTQEVGEMATGYYKKVK